MWFVTLSGEEVLVYHFFFFFKAFFNVFNPISFLTFFPPSPSQGLFKQRREKALVMRELFVPPKDHEGFGVIFLKSAVSISGRPQSAEQLSFLVPCHPSAAAGRSLHPRSLWPGQQRALNPGLCTAQGTELPSSGAKGTSLSLERLFAFFPFLLGRQVAVANIPKYLLMRIPGRQHSSAWWLYEGCNSF